VKEASQSKETGLRLNHSIDNEARRSVILNGDDVDGGASVTGNEDVVD